VLLHGNAVSIKQGPSQRRTHAARIGVSLLAAAAGLGCGLCFGAGSTTGASSQQKQARLAADSHGRLDSICGRRSGAPGVLQLVPRIRKSRDGAPVGSEVGSEEWMVVPVALAVVSAAVLSLGIAPHLGCSSLRHGSN
jgi:hypothetical protein